jgi:hypothetical protein
MDGSMPPADWAAQGGGFAVASASQAAFPAADDLPQFQWRQEIAAQPFAVRSMAETLRSPRSALSAAGSDAAGSTPGVRTRRLR